MRHRHHYELQSNRTGEVTWKCRCGDERRSQKEILEEAARRELRQDLVLMGLLAVGIVAVLLAIA